MGPGRSGRGEDQLCERPVVDIHDPLLIREKARTSCTDREPRIHNHGNRPVYVRGSREAAGRLYKTAAYATFSSGILSATAFYLDSRTHRSP